MADRLQVASFEGGELRFLLPETDSGEVVLALPLSRFIVRVLRVPAENREDPVGFATPVLQAMSPYPDEPLTVGCETVGEADGSTTVIAAALPESAAEDIADALDAKKLNVTRVDALVLGQLRGLWGQVGTAADRRVALLFGGADCLSFVVVEGGLPLEIRAFDAASDLRREIMLCLLEAEDFGGTRNLSEIVCVGDVPTEGLESFAPVRRLTIGEDAGLVGVAERTAEEGSLNVLPASWREVLDETRFKAKLVRRLAVAGGIWLLLVAVLFGVPFVYEQMAGHQKALCKEHQRTYQDVKDTRDKVELVHKYSDHSRGALEIMKAVSDRLPQGIELDNWSYRRDEGVKVSGLADDANLVYEFKNQMAEVGLVSDESGAEDVDGEGDSSDVAERLFKVVQLNGPSAGKGGKQKFDLDCRYQGEEEEE